MLFEISPLTPHLVGIAKLAADSELLESKRRVEYRDLETRRFIGRASGRKMPFDWTINPYRGCEFGCKYCYARYTHEFMELRETEHFETRIYAKQFDGGSFRRELSRIPRGSGMCIGTATDPYQPAERRYRITRSILEVFAEERGHTLSITTKSDLVARDVDVLKAIAARNCLHVFLTITTADAGLARLLEPYAPRPERRFAALAKLSSAGIRVVVLASPMMPLINDSCASLEQVAKCAAEAGAIYLMGGALFLKPSAQRAFFPFLEAEYPHLLRRYRERYERGAFLKGAYPETIKKRVESVREAYGLTAKPDSYMNNSWLAEPQLSLFAG